MDTLKESRRGHSRQATPRLYPLWGMEEPRRESNARRLYRNGDVCLWCRYMIAPRDGMLWMGWTIGDTVVTLAVIAFGLLLIHAIGMGWDGYLAGAGYR